MASPLTRIALLAMDFDGVLTDDRVFVGEDGAEYAACSRSDGMGISLLRRLGIGSVILSSETNPVVAARARKLAVPVVQGMADKAAAFRAVVEERGLPLADVAFIGNDVNDVECLIMAGLAAVPADAHSQAKRVADIILTHRGGHGAVRELIDMILVARRPEPDHAGVTP